MSYKEMHPLVRCKKCEMEMPEHFFTRMENLAQKVKIERINVCDLCMEKMKIERINASDLCDDSPSENMFDSYGSRTGPTEYV